jgi:6,7-dimethyl-8-ribityllumazine synthase
VFEPVASVDGMPEFVPVHPDSVFAVIEERNVNQSLPQNIGDQTKIAFIQASWHADIVGQGRESFLAEMEKLGFPRDVIDIYTVPVAYEIPLHAKRLAKTGLYRGIVACGFVVNGGIYRHDFVAHAVIQGLMQVQLETEIPVFSMVLTPLNFHEHDPHHAFFLEHFVTKGKEAALACINTVAALNELPSRAATAERRLA